jgi:hypothetical protein
VIGPGDLAHDAIERAMCETMQIEIRGGILQDRRMQSVFLYEYWQRFGALKWRLPEPGRISIQKHGL